MTATLPNLRDVGGLRTDDGQVVRRGVLLRGATPAFVDAAGAARLVDDLGLATRIDLRGAAEIEAETSAHLLERERRAVHLPVRAPREAGTFAEAHGPAMVGRYYLAYLAASAESLVALARVLIDPSQTPALAHCTAGKDRTGTAVAVLLDAVGVSHDEIVADYALTHDQMPALRALFADLPTYRERMSALPAEAFAAVPETMETFLSLLATEHRGGRAYLAAHGMSRTELAALTEALVEPVAR
ncbi:tyrosine-protein phosphatase [Aeromicrobium sp. CF3.5]|uniref:tyrosine-protein phosphatase n=1 Tax=Aeromicrobium sp. CF3.5 TaxID=3373078 RepID=UPI003EE631C9